VPYLQQAHPVLDGGLLEAQPPEDGPKDERRRDVHGAPHQVGGLVPRDLHHRKPGFGHVTYCLALSVCKNEDAFSLAVTSKKRIQQGGSERPFSNRHFAFATRSIQLAKIAPDHICALIHPLSPPFDSPPSASPASTTSPAAAGTASSTRSPACPPPASAA
jgi:hypothetical protein